MITVSRLRYRWPRAAHDSLLIDDLAVATGRTVFLHGPSGGGKSTLLGLLAGVLLPSAGTVRLLDTDWSSLSGARRDAFRADHVGYVFQQFNLLPYLSVLDNVLLPCRFSELRRRRAGDQGTTPALAAQHLLRRIGLDESLWTRPAALLSVGQQQRVAAARALIGRPELVIADEPTSALDTALRDDFMDLLLGECRAAGSTLVFVSHDERLAGRFDQRLALAEINRAPQPEKNGTCVRSMRAVLAIALRSAWSRRSTLLLVVLSVALSTFLLIGVERIRNDVRAGFAQSVSGTDLIVGARTGAMQLLLYAVFRVGGATNNVSLSSLQEVARHRAVAWMVPLSLGDSHRGFPVLATTPEYFTRFLYGDRQPLTLAQGRAFDGTLRGLYDTVVGAEVAERLGYRLGQSITLSHGSGAIAGADHGDKPFSVVGVLARTGTPVDRTVHISLQAMEAIHLDWAAGVPLASAKVSAADARNADLTPKVVTAALIGLKNRAAVFAVQRAIADHPGEPLMAVLPGVALDELWDLVGAGERALLAMSALVALVSLGGLVAVVLAGLNERRRELAVLRAVGAAPRHVLLMLAAEGGVVTLLGAGLGALATLAATLLAGPYLQSRFGIGLTTAAPTVEQWTLLGAVVVAGLLASLVPGWRAYRLSLADGLSPPV